MSKSLFNKVLIGIVTAIFTAMIFLNTAEVVFNKDIPVVQAIKPLESQKVVNDILNFYSVAGEKEYDVKTGALGELDFAYLPSIDARVFIARERQIDDTWYFRPNNIHYIPLNYDALGDVGDYLFYTSKSWRAVHAPEELQIGDELRVTNTRSKTISFSITDKQILPHDALYVPSDTGLRQIILVVDDPVNDVYYIYTAR